MKKALKEILKQMGVIAFFCSVMVLSTPNISPDFDEWLTALIKMRTAIGDDAVNFFLIMVPAIVGGIGLVANATW